MANEGLIYVPGNFVCPKCKFHLISKNIYMKSGTIGSTKIADRPECSNCSGVLMEPVTWKDHAESMFNNSEQTFKNGYKAGFRDGSTGKPFEELFR